MKLMKKIGVAMCMALTISLSSQMAFAKETTTIEVAKNIELDVTVDTISEIEEKGSLDDIVIDEVGAGDLTYSKDEDERTIVLSLSGTEFAFTQLPDVSLSKGFKDAGKAKVKFISKKGYDAYKQVAITLPHQANQKTKGKLVISGLKVEAKEKVTENNLMLGIGLLDEKEFKNIKVATMLSYGATVKIDKNYELKAGDSKGVSFDIEEGRADSLVDGRKIEFSVDKGGFQVDKDGKLIFTDIYLNGTKVTNKVEISTYDIKDGKCKSFELAIPGLDPKKRDKISFSSLAISADLGETGDMYLTIESRDIEAKIKEKLAEIQELTNVTATKITTKYGVNKQKGGQIVISEEAKRSLEPGQIKLTFEGAPYVKFNRDPIIEVTEGNLQVKAGGWESENVYVIDVIRKSTKPSVLTIKDFTYSISGTCPSGVFGVSISGNGIAPDSASSQIKIADFVTVTDSEAVKPAPNKPVTPQQSAVTPAGKVVTKFKLGSDSYEMNGTTYKMDAAAYSANGRTMVPVRYVAIAAGINEGAISFENNTIRIEGEKPVVLTLGSKVMMCNGVSVTMDTAPVNVNGRTYVPVAEIARALNIQVNWDSATQTAIFTK